MATLSIREHTSIPIGAAFSAAFDAPMLSKRYARALELAAETHRRTSGQSLVEVGLKQVRTKNHVGVFSFGGDALEILPKIDGLADDDVSSRRWLLHLLRLTRKLKFVSYDHADIGVSQSDFLEYYFQLYCHKLLHEIGRGLPHRYQEIEESLPFIRGRILHPQTIRVQVGRGDLAVCEFDEFQKDNTYNQLLKSALVAILAHAKSPETQQLIRKALFGMDGIRVRYFSMGDLQRLPHDRTLDRIGLLIDMAKAFLTQSSMNPLKGTHSLISLLFDMNRLFEEAIGRLCWELAPDSVRLQKPQRFFLSDVSSGVDQFRLEPDICVMRDDEVEPDICIVKGDRVVQIIDTKWKRLDPARRNLDLSQADLYQMAAYATTYKCNDILLLYPAVSGLVGQLKEYSIKGTSSKIRIGAIDLIRPEAIKPQLRAFLAIP